MRSLPSWERGLKLEKVASTHGNSKYALVYRAAVEVAKLQIDLTGEAPEKDEE